MTLRAVADTHSVVWYLCDDRRLSAPARAAFQHATVASDPVGFSAPTFAEIVFLSKRGRIHADALGRLLAALDRPGAMLRELPVERTVAVLMPTIDRQQIPELPYRIIAATAKLHGVPLVSRDHAIRLSGLPTTL